MLKLLFLTDSHLRATTPASRKDDFCEAMLNKMRWIGEAIKEHNIDAVIHGGDWIDRPDVAVSVMSELAKIIISWKCPVYTVIGNHDIYGYNPETFKRSMLGILEGVGIITRLSSNPIFITNKSGDSVALTGTDAYYGLDKGDVSDYVDTYYHPDHVCIHTVHGFLAQKKWENVPSTAIDEILHTKSNIILTGHEHSGYGIVRKNGKIFCNPGALARVTAGIGDINQVVQVALIKVEKENFDIECIGIPNTIAKPANEVLDREKIVEEKRRSEELTLFMQRINKTSFDKTFDIYNILQELAQVENLDDKIIDMAIKRLQKAEEQRTSEDEE